MLENFKFGRNLTRRQTLALFRGVGTAIFVIGCTSRNSTSAQVKSNTATPVSSTSTPSCIVSPEQTEGPYFVDEKLNRYDIRSNPGDGVVSQGVPLQLTLQVHQVGSNDCTPLAGAIVDIWHCDANGVYSDVQDRIDTTGKKFLRGYQVTDTNGSVNFTTIYPGWYQGRTVHIHFKVRTNETSGQNYEFTSQLYLDDSITDKVHTQKPYANKGQRDLRNTEDRIFQDGGDRLLLKLTKTDKGYAGNFDIGLVMA